MKSETSNVIFREGKRIILRPVERKDLETLRKWINDPKVTRFLNRVYPIMESEEEDWYNNLPKREDNIILAIVVKEGNKLIGTIGLHGIDLRHRHAITGTLIGERDYQSCGYGTEAKMLLLDYAFNCLGLEVIQSRIFAFNKRSINYGKTCGYKFVARIPKWLHAQDGKRYDEVILAVNKDSWKKAVQKKRKKK